jgi:Ca2+-binding RTX toxin-like protein
MMAVTASFSNGVLTVMGDAQDNSLAVSRDAAGSLVVNSDAIFVPIQGGPATAANTTLIQIFGLGGNDELIWSRSTNLPRALVDGGTGNDTITSGTFNDTLRGGAGDDIYRLDTDTTAGSDTIDESGGGIDTLDFSSTNNRTVKINLGNAAPQVINAGLTLTLSAGNTIENVIGGDLNDSLMGNGLDNVITGGPGDDTVVGMAGNDTFQWNPGDGNDIVDGVTGDGLAGSDRLVVNGSDVAEKFNILANGNGAQVTRDVDNILLELVDIETVNVNALGGADTITINDLSATNLTALNLDLDSASGTGFGDNASDSVIVNGTNGNDAVQIASPSFGSPITVGGLLPFVSITGAEGGNDTLTVNTLGGNDVVNASGLFATNANQQIKLTENGGAGNDTLTGSQGFDTFVWNPGDGNDIIEGGDGEDTMIFNGSNVSERIDLSANGGRVRLTDDVGGVTMDLGTVETITVNPLGGADTVTVNDLTGTAVTRINLNLVGAVGGTVGDGQADSVIFNGTNGADLIPVAGNNVVGNNGVVTVSDGGSLPYFMVVTATEGGNDALTVNTLGGNDVVDASGLVATNAFQLIKLTENGGAGNDTLTGSPGADTFVWNPGDGNDTINGGDGDEDTMIFNGSAQAEKFDLSANGTRARLIRDVGGVAMDLGGVEEVDLNPLGGADTITVNDLTGTSVTRIKLNLAGAVGGIVGDGQADSVIFNGTNGADSIPIAGNNNGVILVEGGSLPDALLIQAVEATDALRINGNGGNDTIDASTLQTAVMFTADGGAGNDSIVGSPGNDTFIWSLGDGSDTLDGQAGADTLRFIGSAGADTVTFNGGSISAGGLTVTHTNVETRTFDGQGGGDRLTINGGGVALASTQKLASLTINPGGVLDLVDHSLIVDYTGASPIGSFTGGSYTGITGLIQRGAIISSADTTALTGIGIAEASDVAVGGNFAGLSVDATAVLVKFTFLGDANLDGRLDIDDYVRIDQGIAAGVTGWFNGDFNYDGKVNIDDYVIIDNNILI